MPKSKLIGFARLVDWVEGALDKEEAAAVAGQVAQANGETQATVAWLRTFFQASDTIVLAAPPAKVRDLLTRRFEAYAQDRRQPGFLQRLGASLTFDSKLQLATVSVRDVGMQAPPRQFVFATSIADVALSVRPQADGDSLYVSGQVFSRGDVSLGAFTVQLLQGTTEFGLTTADDLGEFTFAAVPAGVYDMILSSDQTEILIPAVELEA